jgi:hypothetical protein
MKNEPTQNEDPTTPSAQLNLCNTTFGNLKHKEKASRKHQARFWEAILSLTSALQTSLL